MYSSGMVVTLTPWHHGPAASLRTWSKAYVELTFPWPERADMDMPMAVCVAVMMVKLGPGPSDEQIALWREHMTSALTVAVLGVSRGDPVGAFCSCCGRLRRRLAKPIRFVHGRGPRPCTNRLRLRWPCRRRPGELQNTPTTSCANVNVLLSEVTHLEIASPYARNAEVSIQ